LKTGELLAEASSALLRAGAPSAVEAVLRPTLFRMPSKPQRRQRAPVRPQAPPQPAPPIDISPIGPDGPTGNVLYAWDPIAKKERWRIAGAGAGPFAGGTLATAGNLVLDSVNDRLMIFKADTGEKLLELNCVPCVPLHEVPLW
jgi:hypothetical protein